jgi:hypothetical protein
LSFVLHTQHVINNRLENGALIPLQVETAGENVLGSTPAIQPAHSSDIANMTMVQFQALEAAFNLAPGHFGANQDSRKRNTLLFYTAASSL